MTTTTAPYDVIVIGGGVAGLSGAVLLARSRRSVLVIDAGEPRNAPAAGVHNYLGHDGIAPSRLLELGRAEARGYGAEIVDGRVISAVRDADGFCVELADGRVFTARRLLVTTGLVDELPDVPGVRERWGRDVLHCPYCHGWEVRDQAIGVLATRDAAVHMALLFRQLSSDVVLFTHTAPPLTAEQRADLAARDIRIVDGEVVGLQTADDRLQGVRLADGRLIRRQAMVVTPRFVGRSEALASLGLHPTADAIPADPTGQTHVPGVWAAGNLTALSAGVGVAAATAVTAATALNADLVAEDTRRAKRARLIGQGPIPPEAQLTADADARRRG